MPVSSITTSRTYLTQQLGALNDKLAEKTTQLASGKVGSTYGEIGDRRLLDIELTQKVSMIETYQQTITIANLHLETATMSLERLEDIRRDAKSALDTNDFVIQDDGQTQTQSRAELLLSETLNLLNTEIAGYYVFGGTDAVNDPVAPLEDILNGSGSLSGLRDYMDEFASANLGSANTGRTTTSALTTNYAGLVPTDSTFTIAEDGAHDFGFDIASVASTLSNVTVTGPLAADPDTDSFILHVQQMTRNQVLDMLSPCMDFSNYPENHPRYSIVNKAKPGYFKDESKGNYLCEVIGLRSKCYTQRSLHFRR